MNRYFIKLDGVADVTMCSICLENFEEDDRVKTMCKNEHKFHKRCIDTWINNSNNLCPDCRTPLIVSGIVWEVPYDSPGSMEEGDFIFRYNNDYSGNKHIWRSLDPDDMVISLDEEGNMDVMISVNEPFSIEEIHYSYDEIGGSNLDDKFDTIANANDFRGINKVYINKIFWDAVSIRIKKQFEIRFDKIFIFITKVLETRGEDYPGYVDSESDEYYYGVNFLFPKNDQYRNLIANYDNLEQFENGSEDIKVNFRNNGSHSGSESGSDNNSGSYSDGIRKSAKRRKSTRKKSTKRKSTKRKSVRKSTKRRSTKRKSIRRKSIRRKSARRKSVRRRSTERKSVRRN